ncbi:Monothiol glutaredoxin-S3 [Datura stramonium]|uniref:Monothiol glutaredoxin-S3 n=1 Tax=Datura stramonium TaxID=4076 RepID=A0ABS8RZ50_DATST|nr:Monothiol glutaredoxin-S3 [Datura stramonium]
MERVSRMIAEKPVVIFSKSCCCMSYSIKSLFSDLGVNTAVYELDEMPRAGRDIEAALSTLGCNPTVPAVFIGGQMVGGESEVMTLHLQGALKPKLKTAGALWL